MSSERLIYLPLGGAGDAFQPMAHSVRITVLTQDKPGMLGNVSSTISASEANITHAEASLNEDKHAVFHFTLDIRNLEHLTNVIKSIETLNGVVSVKRVRMG